jgi:hypothetical protein
MVNPNPDIAAIQKKAGPDRERKAEKPKTPKTPQMKAASTSAQTKPHKKTEPESDPFVDIVGGVFADAIAPGASVLLGIINTADEATPSGPGAVPPTPGIPGPEPDDNEIEPGD